MRYENGSNFVEIVDGMSSDNAGASIEVWFVETDLSELPGELGDRVGKTDIKGFKNLKRAVAEWAKAHNYIQVQS